MNIAIALPIAIALLCAVAPITYGGLRRIDEKALAKYVKKVGLPLPPPLRTPLLRRIVNSERWSLVGGAVGLVSGAIAALIFGWTGRGDVGALLVMLGVLLGAGFGGAAAVLTGRYDLNPAAPRMARARQTEARDYLTGVEILTARLAPVVALIAMGAGLASLRLLPDVGRLAELVPAYRMSLGLGIASVVATVLSLVVSEVVTRRAMDRPQRAQTELELAWDDVCRADSLRTLSANPVAMGAVAVFASMMMVGAVVTDRDIRAGAMNQTLWLGFGFTAFALVLLAVLVLPHAIASLAHGRRHVLHRLWAGRDFTGAGATDQGKGDRAQR